MMNQPTTPREALELIGWQVSVGQLHDGSWRAHAWRDCPCCHRLEQMIRLDECADAALEDLARRVGVWPRKDGER